MLGFVGERSQKVYDPLRETTPTEHGTIKRYTIRARVWGKGQPGEPGIAGKASGEDGP